MNILLVDHTTIYRDILQQALHGYADLTLSYAPDAAEARAQVLAHEFHFIIVARYLPDADGIDFIRELRRSGRFMFEPLVLLTSSPTAELAADAEQAGVTEIFRKHDIDELLSFLRRFLGVYSPLRGRVLYVEDARDQRLAMAAQLRDWRLQVDAYTSAEEAWDAFCKNDYDLLISDIVLQGAMTGSRLVNRIRRTAGHKGDLPILAMTAFDTVAKRIELFHLGIDDYISKPVILVELHARIHGILSRKLIADRNRTLLEASSLAVLTTDERGLISTVNDEAARLFGCGSHNFSGLDLATFLPVAPYERGSDLLREYAVALGADDARGLPWETQARRRNGELFPVRFSIIETAGMGKQRDFAAIVRDVSAERELESRLLQAKEDAEAATRLKSQFLANMSHEIRTPMNGIMGMMQLALDCTLAAEERNYVSKAYDSAKFLLGVLDDILDFSKIEAGKLSFDSQPFDLDRVLARVRDLLGLRANEKGLKLRVDRDIDAPAALVGDPLRLTQVLNNLVGNGIKFTRQGEVTLGVKLLERDASSQRVKLQFSIRDTGIGISSTQLARLFQPFSQAEASTSREFGGSGLGLVICKHLIERMDGQLSVDSTPAVGSTFSFSAWFGQGSEHAIAREILSGATAPEQQLAGLHVLVVEDNRVNLELVCHCLKRVGITCDTALNGELAVQALSSAPERYQAVLMDMQMPVMDGIEATQRIRQDPACDTLPIIALTANAMAEDRQRCFDAGMQDYVAKPIDRSLLYASLAKWCLRTGAVLDLPETRSLVAAPKANTSPVVAPPPARTEVDAIVAQPAQLKMPLSLELDDLKSAVARMGGDQEMFANIFQQVLSDQMAMPTELRALIGQDDWGHARRVAHTLKGLAATLGAGPLRQLAENLEKRCATGAGTDVSDCLSLIAEIEARLQRLHTLSGELPACLAAL